jgi:hypothetical protein
MTAPGRPKVTEGQIRAWKGSGHPYKLIAAAVTSGAVHPGRQVADPGPGRGRLPHLPGRLAPQGTTVRIPRWRYWARPGWRRPRRAALPPHRRLGRRPSRQAKHHHLPVLRGPSRRRAGHSARTLRNDRRLLTGTRCHQPPRLRRLRGSPGRQPQAGKRGVAAPPPKPRPCCPAAARIASAGRLVASGRPVRPAGWSARAPPAGGTAARRRVLPGGFAPYALCIGGCLAEKACREIIAR